MNKIAASVKSYEEYLLQVESLNATSFGTSAGNLPLHQIILNNAYSDSKPNVAIICNKIGNEISSTNICLDISSNKNKLSELLSNYNIFIIPTLNIDGLKKAFTDVNKGTKNDNMVDISRSFPNLRNNEIVDDGNVQPEVNAAISFFNKIKFQGLLAVGSSGTGILYPLYYREDEHEGTVTNKVYRKIAKDLVTRHSFLTSSRLCARWFRR